MSIWKLTKGNRGCKLFIVILFFAGFLFLKKIYNRVSKSKQLEKHVERRVSNCI